MVLVLLFVIVEESSDVCCVTHSENDSVLSLSQNKGLLYLNAAYAFVNNRKRSE